jgi:hypothetical protein
VARRAAAALPAIGRTTPATEIRPGTRQGDAGRRGDSRTPRDSRTSRPRRRRPARGPPAPDGRRGASGDRDIRFMPVSQSRAVGRCRPPEQPVTDDTVSEEAALSTPAPGVRRARACGRGGRDQDRYRRSTRAKAVEVAAASRGHHADVVEAEIVAMPTLSVRTRRGMAVPDAQTDEWIQPQVDEVPPAPAPPTGPASTGLEVPFSRDPVRAGPGVLEADSWDLPPDTDLKNEAYHGRRRAATPPPAVDRRSRTATGDGGWPPSLLPTWRSRASPRTTTSRQWRLTTLASPSISACRHRRLVSLPAPGAARRQDSVIPRRRRCRRSPRVRPRR